MKTGTNEVSKEEKWKNTKGQTSNIIKTRNSSKKNEKCMHISSDDDLLIQRNEKNLKGKKILI